MIVLFNYWSWISLKHDMLLNFGNLDVVLLLVMMKTHEVRKFLLIKIVHNDVTFLFVHVGHVFQKPNNTDRVCLTLQCDRRGFDVYHKKFILQRFSLNMLR